MLRKFSHKDMLLILGILVAAIIALTTWVYTEHPSAANTVRPVPGKTSEITKPVTIMKRFFEKVVLVSAAHSAPSSR